MKKQSRCVRLKKLLCILIFLALLTGCKKETVDEEEKSDYLAWKSDLVEREDFIDNNELNCDITVSVERIDDESISYTTVVSNPKEDMKDIKMLVVHNYFTEDVFPSVGVFDKTRDLLVDNNDDITLVGYIDTTKDIKKLDLEVRIWIQYTDANGNLKDIYYKTTK